MGRLRQMVITFLATLCVCASTAMAQATFSIRRGQSVVVRNITVSPGYAVQNAVWMLAEDICKVLDAQVLVDTDTVIACPQILVGTMAETFPSGSREAFRLSLTPEGALLVEGSDDLGTAYGILEISHRMGVSPWEWWAEAELPTLQEFVLHLPTPIEETPYVEHRGIFINDEDWCLAPWASRQQRELGDIKGSWKYGIGPLITYKICQLLLRLKADTYWPAMHDVTRPFFFTDGDSEVLKQFGIYIGTSHCEPMLCNAFGEWGVRGEGDYNFATNSEGVKAFWQERLNEVVGQPAIYTLGMRGLHDGPMEGASTPEEQKELLEGIFATQQEMLRNTLGSDADGATQIFIPYKEVLDAVDAGLRIPDNVAVIQCDDNYGYIRWPADTLLTKPAGTGLYYHVSYWGRPHDYLWLSTTHPRLVQEELVRFAQSGRQRLWILNVGDIKPAEYQIQLFMDIAWNPLAFSGSEAWKEHLKNFLMETLHQSLKLRDADSLTETISQFYDIVFDRRPEFLAGTRTEETNPRWTQAEDLPWSERRLRAYRNSLIALSDEVECENPSVAWMHLVQYPVQGAAQMAVKHVEATLARHGLGDWDTSDRAHDSIQTLTMRYNTGRWEGFMDASLRQLTVFQKAERTTTTTPLCEEEETLLAATFRDSVHVLDGWRQQESLCFATKKKAKGQPLAVEVSVLPTHPRHGERLCLSVSIDDGEPQQLDFTTQGRSEDWKENVLRNSAVCRTQLTTGKGKHHTLTLRHLSGGEIFPLGVKVIPVSVKR